MTTLAWGARFNAEERGKLVEIAAALGCDPSWLTACMAFETGRTFDPAIRNKITGATGLIQFMPSTARDLGTTTDALAAMSRIDQLAYVYAYFKPYAGRLRNLGDAYMAVLWPRAVGQPDDYVIFADGTSAYAANSGLDISHDGEVTRGECLVKVHKLLDEGLRPENAADSDTQPAAPIVDAGRPYQAPPAPKKSVVQPQGGSMPLLALISAFGPILSQLIPQLTTIFAPKGEVGQRNLKIAEVALNTITQAASATNVQEAVEKMQASPELVKTVTEAVVTQPEIMAVLTLPADAAKAVERSIVMQNAERPAYMNPLVWITAALVPMMYLLTTATLFLTNAGLATDGTVTPGAPWYTVLGFDPSTRSGLVNLIVGFVFGGVTGVWFGTSASSQRNAAPAAK